MRKLPFLSLLVLFVLSACRSSNDAKNLRKSDYFQLLELNTPDIKKLKSTPYRDEELESVALFSLKNNRPEVRTPEIVNVNANTLEYHITDINISNPRVWAEHVCTRFIKKNGFWYAEWMGKVWKCNSNKEGPWHKKKCN